MKSRIVLTAATLAVLAGCAKPPERIAGVPNAGPCTTQDRERLAILSNKQSSAAAGDALGVFLVGVPVSSLAGADNETEIAILKGRCGDPDAGNRSAKKLKNYP